MLTVTIVTINMVTDFESTSFFKIADPRNIISKNKSDNISQNLKIKIIGCQVKRKMPNPEKFIRSCEKSENLNLFPHDLITWFGRA